MEDNIKFETSEMSDQNMATTRGLADPVLLDKIDRLYKCNIGQHVPLPQLVVVGDQSSGKSSVLEGLTRLPFPRDSGLCTRFATQITFRREANTMINISIIPDQNASAEHIAVVEKFGYKYNKQLDPQLFANIISEAQECIRTDGYTFSNDVLKLELGGPEEEQLSVIDVPGIFRKTTAGLTTDADIQLVRSMVIGYMENPRSVMLTVIPANVDIATQEIVDLAKSYDPEGIRTLGVLTKPDLVDEGAEHGVIDILEGKKEHLSLGWHVVRNLGQQQLGDSSVDRLGNEKAFFATKKPWKNLAKDVVGIDTLKERLKDILTEHVRREFPGVRSELNKKLTEAQRQLDSLGKSRANRAEQSQYLTDMASKFQEIMIENLVTGPSLSYDTESESGKKLVTQFKHRSRSFAEDMRLVGHTFNFKDANVAYDQDMQIKTKIRKEKTPADPPDAPSEPIRAYDQNRQIKTKTRKEKTPADLQGALSEPDSLRSREREDILEVLKWMYHNSQGFELGTFPPSILPRALKRQSENWQALIIGYIEDMICITHTFTMATLESVCPEDRVYNAIKAEMSPRLMDEYQATINHGHFLLQLERCEVPYTENSSLSESSKQSRAQRHVEAASGDGESEEDSRELAFSNEDHICEEVHDILKSYYSIALERMIDNVCKQIAVHFLLIGPKTPLKLFCPSFVAGLTDDQLKYIAGEEPSSQQKRKRLESEIADLEAGKKILF